ncbi:MAG: hypothetical protein AAFP03_03825 [Cyanobacteria bacterium J06598_3]
MTTLPTTCQYLSSHSRAKTSALSGLIAPLQQLDQRLQQTIEVTQILCGTAFQQYLLGSIVPAMAPSAVVTADSALGQLQTNFGLSDFDVSVVVMAIAPELDRRYERLYATLQSTGARKPSLALALSVLCTSEAAQQIERERFLTNSPIRQLLQPLNEQRPPNPEHATNKPSSKPENKPEGPILQLKTAVSRYLLNQRAIEPLRQLASYCQLSWPQRNLRAVSVPQSNHTKTPASQPVTSQSHPDSTDDTSSNHPILAALIARIQQEEAPLPLSLQFCGQCVSPGQKQQAAAHLAIAAKAPLLRVNLTQLIRTSNLNAVQSKQAVEQVILQSQLWGAVLYLEDTTELPIPMPAFIHPGLIEKLSIQLAHYPGMTIFAGSSPQLPSANGGKGILPIPFTAPPASKPQTKQQPVVTAAQLALNEIDKFRIMLMQSSVEFG